MDCDYKDDGGATAGLNVNNNLNPNSLFLKSSASLLETNNNEQCLITKESDAHELCNGIVGDRHTEKNLHGEISLCTKINQLNGDLAVKDEHTKIKSPCDISLCAITNQISQDLCVGKGKSECKPLPEGILQSSISDKLSSAEDESSVENGSSTNQVDNCIPFVSDSEYLVEQTDVLDNGTESEKTVDFMENLAENVSEERVKNSHSLVDLEKFSENISDVCASAASLNLQSEYDTLKESIPVQRDAPEICINTKSNDEISKNELVSSNSEILDALDESVSEEEVYLEVDDDEQESDLSAAAESGKEIDLKSCSICDVSDDLKTSDLVNENNKKKNVPMSGDIFSEKSLDESITESEVCVKVGGLSDKGKINFEISDKKLGASLSEKSSEIPGSNLDGENPQIESKSKACSSLNEQVKSEIKNSYKNETAISDVSVKSDITSLELNVADEENSSKNSIDMETSENVNTVEINIAAEEESSTNTLGMDANESVNTVEINIAAEEESSTNILGMDTNENVNTVEINIVAEEESSTNILGMDANENVKTVELNITAEGDSLINAIDMDTSEIVKNAESNIAVVGNSSEDVTGMETSESAESVDSNTATQWNSSKKVTDMNIVNEKTVELNIAVKGNFLKITSDMETENVKTLEPDISAERKSLKNATDMEAKESAKPVVLNIAGEENFLKTTSDIESSESMKAMESNIAVEEISLRNAIDLETSKNEKIIESNIAEGYSTKNVTDMETSEKAKNTESKIAESNSPKVAIDMETNDNAKVESNITAKGNSTKDDTDMETSEKTNDLDDFVVLSDIDWSDDDASDKQKTKVETQNVENDECVQNEKKCSIENESLKNTVNENTNASSDGDDFDLDDVIEEFAKEEEKKVVKLSDDELDDLVEEFVEAECSSPSAEKNKEPKSKDIPSESDDEMELLIEDFKAVDSDNDCFIVQDSDNIVIINDDNKDSQPKKKKSKPNNSLSSSCINPTESRNEVKRDAVSSSHTFSKNLEPETSDKVFKNDKILVQENEVGSLKSEVFNDGVGKTKKQNNGSVLLEIVNNGNSEGAVNKKNISIISALPLSERSRKKVTLECRTDGVYLKRDPNTDDNTSSHCTNENSEKRNIKHSIDTSNNVLNCRDKLSVDHSVTNCTISDSIEEQCMHDMLSKVCASSGTNSTNDEEYKSVTAETESKKVNASIQLTSQNSDVKSLGSLCHDTLEESKKRKLEVVESKPDEAQKKMKTEVNGVESDTDIAPSSVSHIDNSIRNRVLQHFKEAFPTKVQLKKSWLEKLSKRLCQETILEEYKQKIVQENDLIKKLEDQLQALEDELCYSQSQATTFLSVQQELFQKHQFAPQTAVRTVAVNVKIFRECDVPQPIPLPIVPKVEVPTHTTEIHGSTPVPSTPPIKVQVPQQKIHVPPVQQIAVPQTSPSARFVSNPLQPRAVITSPQRSVPIAPNVTMMKKEVPPGMSSSQSVRPRSYLAEKNQPQTKTCKQVIDLTDEESSNKKLMPASSTLVSLASNSVSKVNLPGLQNNQNVLLPLNGLFQMVPASTPNNAQFSLSNPVQVQHVSRQTLVPSLPPNLLGPRTVAYIIPSNSGQISTIGRNSLPVSNFVPGTNQRLQTLIVRMTNPGQVPSPMSTVVNSNPRMQVLTQGLRTPVTKNSPISSSASDLVLFPRQPKHPAPFPALPEYRQNPQLKGLPPKPSLKGSKAPNGIILSWNMNLLSLHAEISNYQLFAYQEAPGPVNASLWKKVGDVKALPLPMACTLTQFVDGNRYYFTVRAADVHNRFGPYSDAVSILFSDAKDNSKSLNK